MQSAKRRRQAGFSFIEILVVMGIISVLVSMVVVIIPMITERSRQTESKDNVKALLTHFVGRVSSKGIRGWPPYNGKNFVLSLVATRQLKVLNKEGKVLKQNVKILFSPGDTLYNQDRVDYERYKDVNKTALKNGTNFEELTSYAGRRNAEREHMITPSQMGEGTIVICDDDDGALHHPDGLVAGYSGGNVQFMEWEEFEMLPPDDPDNPEEFLGDAASSPELMKMYGH